MRENKARQAGGNKCSNPEDSLFKSLKFGMDHKHRREEAESYDH